jgi:hypothetical protein
MLHTICVLYIIVRIKYGYSETSVHCSCVHYLLASTVSFIYLVPINLKYLKLSCNCHLPAFIIFLSSCAQAVDFVMVMLCVFCEVGTEFFIIV